MIAKLFEAEVYSKSLYTLQNEEDDLKLEASHVFEITLANCGIDEVRELIRKGLIESVLKNSEFENPPNLIDISLDILRRLLHHGQTMVVSGNPQKGNPVAQRIFEIKGDLTLEQLQKHKNPDIYHKVSKLFDDFFICDYVH